MKYLSVCSGIEAASAAWQPPADGALNTIDAARSAQGESNG